MRYTIGDVELYQQDCFDLLNSLPEQSIDFICIDPPYEAIRQQWDKRVNFERLFTLFQQF